MPETEKDSRAYPDHPILAVSAIIRDHDGKVLIVRRAKDPGCGLWSLPGGAVKLGEKLHEALHREIREECGIPVTIERLIEAFDRIFKDQNGRVLYHYVVLNYLCKPAARKVSAGSDAADLAWITKSDLTRYHFTEGVPELLEQVL